ncbi:MAG TPA: CDC27 family protein, partial [Terriglobales bacterium]
MRIPRSALAFLVLAVTPVVQAQAQNEAPSQVQAPAPMAATPELELPQAESPDVTLSSQLDRFIDEHRADKAGLLAAFRFISSRNDDFPDVLYSKLTEYLRNFDPAEAARMSRVCTFRRIENQRDPAKRAALIGEFLDQHPDDPQAGDAAAERFQIMRELQDLEGAESAYRQRVLVDGDSPDTYAAMAAVYIEHNVNLTDAQGLLERAQGLLKSSGTATSRVTYFLVLSPDPARAESDIAYWQARAYLLQKEPAQAVAKIEKALVNRKDADTWYVAAEAQRARGKVSKAIESYMEAAALPSVKHVQQMAELEKLWVGGQFGTRPELEQRLRAIERRNFQSQSYVPTLTDRLARDFNFTT